MKKKVLIVIGGLVLILVVFVWQVIANLDNIVAGVIEDSGSTALQTKVRVSDVSIDLKAAKAGIGGLTIANPAGYSSADLIDMEGINVDLDLQSIGKDVLVIESIIIRNPKISFEVDDKGNSNMQTLMDNIEKAMGEGDSATAGSETKLIIKHLEFTGGVVTATTPANPDKPTQVKLPAIRMSNIGSEQGGVTADVAAKQIATRLANKVINAAAKASVEKLIEKKASRFLDKLKGKG